MLSECDHLVSTDMDIKNADEKEHTFFMAMQADCFTKDFPNKHYLPKQMGKD